MIGWIIFWTIMCGASLAGAIVTTSHKEWVSACILYAMLLLSIWAIIISTTLYEKDKPKVIHCSKIEQIDTLYRNDSIVGYEITIVK